MPLYSLVLGPLALTTTTLIEWAHLRDIIVSIDASSAAVIAEFGVDRAVAMLTRLRPEVLLCNELEAECLGDAIEPSRIGSSVTIVKQGAGPTLVRRPGHETVSVATPPIEFVRDTTGAGDAFAAGFLTAFVEGKSPELATMAGHRSAADQIAVASAQTQ